MKRAVILMTKFSSYTPKILPTPPKSNPNTSFSPLVAASTRFGLRFLSSESESSKDTNFPKTQNGESSSDDNAGGVSKQELKRQIERYFEGDEEAIPAIFEAILKRKLAGIDEDDELMEELRQKGPMGDIKDEEFDSDIEKCDDSDKEL